MATQVYVGRMRSIVPVCALTLLTLGIYFLVWYYQVNRELWLHRGKGPDPMLLVALFLLVPVIGWVLAPLITARQLQRVQAAADADARTSAWFPALWGLVPVLGWVVSAALLQQGANRAWSRLHEDLAQATVEPPLLQCPDCAGAFRFPLNFFGPTSVRCPQCGRAADV